MKTYGESLRELRKRAGYSLVQAAKELRALGISATNTGISRWENGYNNPTLDQFLGMCNLYGVRDVTDVFEKENLEGMETDLNHDGLVMLQHFQDILSRNPRYQRITPGSTFAKAERDPMPAFPELDNEDFNESKRQKRSKPAKRRYVVQILPQKEVDGQLVDPYVGEEGEEDEEAKIAPKGPKARQIKCYDIGPAAGGGNILENSSYETITLAPNAPTLVDYAVRVNGESMMPLLADGQMLYIHSQPELQDGETGIFSLNGAAYVKQLRIIDGASWLVSANPKFDPIPVLDTDDLTTLGRVVSPRVNPQAIRLPKSLRLKKKRAEEQATGAGGAEKPPSRRK